MGVGRNKEVGEKEGWMFFRNAFPHSCRECYSSNLGHCWDFCKLRLKTTWKLMVVTLVSEPAQSAWILSSSPVDPLAMTTTPLPAVVLTHNPQPHAAPSPCITCINLVLQLSLGLNSLSRHFRAKIRVSLLNKTLSITLVNDNSIP